MDKVLVITPEELKVVLCDRIFAEGGTRIYAENCELHFIKDGCSTRVDDIHFMIARKEADTCLESET